jgi:chemotaxis methyl-accepting protein methylase
VPGAALERSPARIELAVSTLLIGVTDFFRDAGVFEMLSGTVVPALARRGGPVGVLSAGCSSGAELYSVAMLLDEARLLDQATLLGVDCRRDAVVRAREGLFDETLLATLAPEQRARYFEAERGGGRAIGRLRVRTEWRVLDVVQSVPDGPWDIALCRNLLMYLRSDAADAVCRSLAARLAPGGVLVLGRAERPPAGLPLTLLARCVYQRR